VTFATVVANLSYSNEYLKSNNLTKKKKTK